MDINDIQNILAASRLNFHDVCTLCRESVGIVGLPTREAIYAFSHSTDRLTAFHALNVLCQIDSFDLDWIATKRNEIADRILMETDVGMLRLELKLLLRLHWHPEDLRPDLVDFCLERITRTALPYAIRSQCMKLACKQMTRFPELTDELDSIMQMMDVELLSPGLRSTRRQVLADIKRARKKQA